MSGVKMFFAGRSALGSGRRSCALLVAAAAAILGTSTVRAQEEVDPDVGLGLRGTVPTKRLLVVSYGCNPDFLNFCNAGASPNTVLSYPPTGSTVASTVHINNTHLDGPLGIVLHPLRGTLLVSNRPAKRIDEFNARTGAWIRTFASRNVENDMNSPQYMIFRRNSDHLLVGVHPNSDNIDAIDGILEFDGEGNYVGVFVPNPACINGPNGVPGGGDDRPYTWPLESAAQMTWGLPGTAHADRLYVASQNNNAIVEYDINGCYNAVMGSQYLLKPEGLTVRPAGSVSFNGTPNAGNMIVTTLYPDVSSVPPAHQQHGIVEFSPATRQQVQGLSGENAYAFALGLGFPGALTFDPDGRILVGDRFWYYQSSSQYSDRVRRLNQQTGQHISYISPSTDRKLRSSEGMLIVNWGYATGNADGDGDVDFQDYMQFEACFGIFNPPASCIAPFDDNLNGVIDLADFDAFVANCTSASNCTSINTCVGQANGTGCDDGNMCTDGDTCQNQLCVGGPALDCDDDNACTDDSCHPLTGCSQVPNTGTCTDGDACTVGDACVNGECVSGNPRVCSDTNGCTTDSCNPATGCVFTNNSNPCDDANACTEDDTCTGGACVGTFFSCNDNDPCTLDGCMTVGGCTHTPIPCGGACCNGTSCTQVSGPSDCTFVCSVADLLPTSFAGCFGDADGNGVVNAADRGFVAANIGLSDPVNLCLYDIDGNGFINAGDRGFVAVNIGLCAPLPDYMDGSGMNGGVPDERFPGGVFMGEGTSCGTVTCD